MPKPADSEGVHPVTEQFAIHLYHYTRPDQWPESLEFSTEPWERTGLEQRAAFRERARQFMNGDLSVMPTPFNPLAP